MGVTTERCRRTDAPHAGAGRAPITVSRLTRDRVRSRLTAVAVAAVTVIVAAGCGGSGVPAQTPSVTSDPTSSSSSRPAQTEQQLAGAEAVAQVIRYERLLDDLALDRSRSLDQLYTVGTQPDVTDEIATLLRFRSSGDRQTGSRRVTSTRIDRVSLRIDGSRRPPLYPTVNITACVDVSAIKGVDRSGRSLVARGRTPYQLTRLTLINTSYPDQSGWKVSKVTDVEQQSCRV